ncbi:MAG TPA: hypothetical protein DCF93_08470 [Desulfuromonas sp.]|nr:hypothetical protein [Desulfuromonas sp.]
MGGRGAGQRGDLLFHPRLTWAEGPNLQIESEDFEYAPFAQEGGIGKGWQLFGEDLQRLLDELNGALVA